MEVDEARELARSLLAEPLPRRWAHTRGVAARARVLAPVLNAQAGVVEAGAWLHDIGYSPRVADTGFHPLDGARYLRDHGHGDLTLWAIVAHHTGAATEAELRGLLPTLVAEFPRPVGEQEELARALTACDLTTGPDGDALPPAQRLAEILNRYPPDDVVHRSVRRSGGDVMVESARYLKALGW